MKRNDIKYFTYALIFSVLVTLQTRANSLASESGHFNRDLKNYNAKIQIAEKNETKIAEFFIAIADDEETRREGLMNLNSLPSNCGMLFIFEKKVIDMWMKNTRINLDMIFIDENDEIVNIFKNAPAYSTDIISSKKQVAKVLEINAKLTDKFGIKIGQKIKIIQ